MVDSMSNSYPIRSCRTSKDHKVDKRGRLLLDFLACQKLTIINGNTLGDIFGEYTSVSYNGCSVIDYMAATPNLKEKIETFKVMDLTKFSDHKPCICKLKCTNEILSADDIIDSLDDAPIKYRWSAEDKSLKKEFHTAQTTPEFKQKITEKSQKKRTSMNSTTK